MNAITLYIPHNTRPFLAGCAAGALACIAIRTLLKQPPALAPRQNVSFAHGHRCETIDKSLTLGEGCSKAEVMRLLIKKLNPNAELDTCDEERALTSLGIAAKCLGQVQLSRETECEIRKQLQSELLSWVGNRFNVSYGTLATNRVQANTNALGAIKEYMTRHSKKTPPYQVITVSWNTGLIYTLDELGLEQVRVSSDEAKWQESVNDHTIAIMGYALNEFGVVDPITKMAAFATRNGIMMHVDAYTGGSVLPCLDLEKCPPLTPKGVSSLTVRPEFGDNSLTAVFFTSTALADYASFQGMVPLSLVAAEWVAARQTGGLIPIQSAQMRLATVAEIKRRIRKEVPELTVVGDTHYTTLLLESKNEDITPTEKLIERMKQLGWNIGNWSPLQLVITASMARIDDIDDKFICDLKGCITAIKQSAGGASASDPAEAT